MTRSTKILTVVVVILGIAVAWLLLRERLPQVKEPEVGTPPQVENKPVPQEEFIYKNEKYGFRFSYMAGYKVLEASPEIISIGKESRGGFSPLAQVVLVRSGPDTGVLAFEEFVIDSAREYCMSKKADSSSECTRIDDVVNIAPFKSASGVSGQVFYLRYEETNFETGKVVKGRRGPFYTFNTSPSTPNEMSFIMIYNPISITAEKADEMFIGTIASSFVYRP